MKKDTLVLISIGMITLGVKMLGSAILNIDPSTSKQEKEKKTM